MTDGAGVMAPPQEPPGDREWPQADGWRTAAGWLWLGYFAANALLGVWLLG